MGKMIKIKLRIGFTKLPQLRHFVNQGTIENGLPTLSFLTNVHAQISVIVAMCHGGGGSYLIEI